MSIPLDAPQISESHLHHGSESLDGDLQTGTNEVKLRRTQDSTSPAY